MCTFCKQEIQKISYKDNGIFSKIHCIHVIHSCNLYHLVPPALNKDVTVKTKTERDSVSLPCIATAGNPKPINFQWLKEKGSTFEPVTGVMLHNTRYDYNITSVGREHRGVYKCKVWNIGGNDEYRITLNVYCKF